jgi:hypothetical protein
MGEFRGSQHDQDKLIAARLCACVYEHGWRERPESLAKTRERYSKHSVTSEKTREDIAAGTG